ARAYIGIGSNEGDRRANIDPAVAALRAGDGVEVLLVSPLIETAPAGGPAGQGAFVNGAAVLETRLTPEALLSALQAIERQLGRRRGDRWGPRVIDLDLLLFGGKVIANGRLRVPHLRLRERAFVLEPLAAVAGDAVDPISGRTMAELWERVHG
ncbi:MAG TPA: 2-amino-4-hydroxy-6-hydroxymethyldihydropteridine diphosphokinase, partial [Vicinamibacterales bacterium]|nr:2-amino-4-hydroxy-6-hydroxymethyldihydropteridine diphosphokinase [Vicinamibacterales bacterium]